MKMVSNPPGLDVAIAEAVYTFVLCFVVHVVCLRIFKSSGYFSRCKKRSV